MVFRMVSKRVKRVHGQSNHVKQKKQKADAVRKLYESCFFVNRSISDILQENWKRVVLFSPRLRLGLGRPFDIRFNED